MCIPQQATEPEAKKPIKISAEIEAKVLVNFECAVGGGGVTRAQFNSKISGTNL